MSIFSVLNRLCTHSHRALLTAVCGLFFGLVCSLAVAMPVQASSLKAAPWYRVEVMLVAYQNEETIDNELWPDAINTQPPSAEVYQQYADAEDHYNWWTNSTSTKETKALAEFDFSQVPTASLPTALTPLEHKLFADKAEKINRRRDMQVIWHQAWVEPIQDEKHAIQHPIDVELSGPFTIQLRGTLQLYVSRYLHINSDLTVQHYQLEESPELAALNLPSSQSAQTDYREELYSQESLSLTEQKIIPIRSAHIQQSRRMRSNELHYIDHPMLGMVVKVIPIETEADIAPLEDNQ
ncbi:CsiV family protein [Bacterioplanoides sp.]|uniref:CsiV family protein n=1 Tax=Bacterioplanoides sp. TaxID=2066072 RepID=UPI003AFFCA00